MFLNLYLLQLVSYESNEVSIKAMSLSIKILVYSRIQSKSNNILTLAIKLEKDLKEYKISHTEL